uniref:Putative terminase n=1 Tax=viral metagenome TaxID=1070528 RepID=A0A6M3K1S5_9ZZZZ
MTHPAIKYAEDVLSEKVLACKWVHLACKRFFDDLDHSHERGLYFDEARADHALKFFSHLRLWKGKENKGKEFVLAPHYQFIVSNIMGWVREDGKRRFRTAYIEMGRKGAKSTFAGGLASYFFLADGEEGAEIYTAAVTREQARLVWTNIQNLTKKTIFAPLISYYKHNLSVESTWSKCEPLSSDAKSLDGLDTHFGSLDELHAHSTPEVHDSIDDSTGARSQPLILIITTAGYDQSGICYQRREYLTKILKGFNDDTFFGIIFTLDVKKDWPELQTAEEHRKNLSGVQEDDWQDEDLWCKPMPGLCGVSESGQKFGIDADGEQIPGYMTKIEDVRKKAKYAIEMPGSVNNFLTKRMNIWTQQYTRWLSLDLWDSNFTKEVYCYD